MSDQGADYTYQAPTQCYVGDNTTDFKNLDMDTMKGMVQNANPENVHRAARGWTGVHDQLVAAKEAYEHAVSEVMEHWEGPSADQFQARSKVISKKIHDTSTYATQVSTAMTSAANVLGDIQKQVVAMQKPSAGESRSDRLTDINRDEDGLNRDLADKNVTAQQIADGREGDMSAGREAQMAMAVKMEALGAAYNSQTKSMGSWSKRDHGDSEEYPGEPGGVAPVPIVAGSVTSPSGSAGSGNLSRSGTSGAAVKGMKSPTAGGISGGIGSQKPTAGSQIGAGNLSFNGGSGAGTGGVGTGTGAGGIGGGMAGSGAGGVGSGGPGGTGIAGGIGAGAGLGAGAAGRGGAGAMGRGGLGGGAGSGAAGKEAAKGLKGNSLARTKGGEIGKSVVKPGSGQQGGSALRQKPKTATGGAGQNAGRNGLAGHGAQTGKGKDKKGRDNSRPDYLVEDEETWANSRTVNPRVVE
ncbi:PPE domain-containing protein [Streptomyces sp. NBC_01016]|uniref:WXG100 family type VII secretion target n=1 Tax=Streptomyces sp. NBC_01016 TaxID=2903720 RepID=UPI0022516009|nr:PPE domain-containing protein [Streptomyces sp. NBC_01016]MCX4829795.1 PPE domain-containing protein [Streptomyces sp. NBC_01016]